MKKKNSKQRHKRKKEINKMGTVKQFNKAPMAIPTAEEQLVQLKANEMQLEQNKAQSSHQYAQEFTSLFISLASNFFKEGTEDAVAKAKAATEEIRKAAHVYVDELKESAPEDPRFVEARKELEDRIKEVQALIDAPEVLDADEPTGNETVEVAAEVKTVDAE